LLGSAGVRPDFSYTAALSDAFLDWIHRSVDGTEIYFIANRMDRSEKADCSFRVGGKQPERWDPVTGTRQGLPQSDVGDGCTTVPLAFGPNESMFVVFRKEEPAAGVGKIRSLPDSQPLQDIAGPWTVRFDPQWFYPTDGLSGDQAMGLFVFEKLEDWSTRPEPAVKYYSGTAVYQKTFDIASEVTARSRLYLDLGTVKETARVRLNGNDLGVVWCHPWQVEITGAIKPGGNKLEIEVANLWPNRLAGDAKLPEGQRRTQTNFPAEPNQSLLPSGLLGPVRVLARTAD
jgi:hypothetical protein